ncbi:MAG: DUF4382 domain-containing protein [Balneolaceae bacterium]|nr:DUF4382 domain-containing protein [Balneolaceae bacterium]
MNTIFTHFRKFTFFFALIIGSLVFTQCEGPLSSTDSDTGRLLLKLTDDPFPTNMVEEANVTIDKVEIRRANAEEDGDDNPFTVLTEKDTTLNLLDLTNGVTATLADLEIEAGSYDLIRLYISDASVKLIGENEPRTMKVPSGAQTGLKIFVDPAIDVAGGLTAELLLDINVSKSFVVQGNPNTPAGIRGFIFKPVIRASNQSTSGRINGTISDGSGNPLEDAEVWVTKADTVYSSTFSDSTGFYALIGLPEGDYNLHGTATDFDTTTVENVTVTAGNETTEDLTINEL